MIHFPRLRGFLRTLVGLDDRSGSFWGVGRSVASDIERARWRRAMRESGRRSAESLRDYFDHINSGGSGIEFVLAEHPEMFEPPPARPMLYSPDVYRELLARSGASLRPPPRSRRDDLLRF